MSWKIIFLLKVLLMCQYGLLPQFCHFSFVYLVLSILLLYTSPSELCTMDGGRMYDGWKLKQSLGCPFLSRLVCNELPALSATVINPFNTRLWVALEMILEHRTVFSINRLWEILSRVLRFPVRVSIQPGLADDYQEDFKL